ncbi:MAG: arsinothricin resistance N-acetyltransferase ArsN1 family B [Candidatus Binatia bacterium]
MSLESARIASIRDARPTDAPTLTTIYNHYIAESVITFEEHPVPPDEFARRIEAVQSASLPWLVAEQDGEVIGYAYATKWRDRSAYRFSVEVTVYLSHTDTRRGIGTALYAALFPMLKARGVHIVIGGITLPNEASVALHEKFGMHKVAHFEQVGFKFDRWLDVGYWQCTLS